MKNLSNQLEKALEFVVGILCLILISILGVEVLNRYFFGISWPWAQYLIPFCFLWMCMIGSAIAVRRRQHFEVDLLANLLRGRPRRLHRFLMAGSNLIGGVMIAWASVGFVALGLQKSSPATGTPMIYIYVSILIGGLLIMFFAFDRLLAADDEELQSRFDEATP